jgi:hypothetical protein
MYWANTCAQDKNIHMIRTTDFLSRVLIVFLARPFSLGVRRSCARPVTPFIKLQTGGIHTDGAVANVCAQDKDTGMHMLRATDFFGRAEGRGALANDVWAENAWRGYVRGQTQTSMDFRGTRRARLSKCAPSLAGP